jgi:hypothetical protein
VGSGRSATRICPADVGQLVVALAQPVDRVRCSPEPARPLRMWTMPFVIHQESSGADQWNGPIIAIVTARFRFVIGV